MGKTTTWEQVRDEVALCASRIRPDENVLVPSDLLAKVHEHFNAILASQPAEQTRGEGYDVARHNDWLERNAKPKPEQAVGDGVVVGYIREQDVAHLKGGNRNDWRWSYIASAPNESHTLPVYTTPRPAVATPAEVTDETNGLREALEMCERWFAAHCAVAPLIGGLGHAEHPMLTMIRGALTAQCQVSKDGQGVGNAAALMLRKITERVEHFQRVGNAGGHYTDGRRHEAQFILDTCNAALASPSAGVVVPDGWLPIENAPEGETLIVGWYEDGEFRRTFDAKDDGCWVEHAEHYEHFCAVAGAGMRGPKETAPYTHWHPLAAAPEVPRG